MGCGAKPEVATIDKLQSVGFIEDGRMFAREVSVFACHSNITVAVEEGEHIADLTYEGLLGAKDVGLLEVDEVADDFTADLPYVALKGIVAVFVADIVGAHIEVLPLDGKGEEEGEREECNTFHETLYI